MDNEAFEGRRAVRYLGQYKPVCPYPLADGLLILPAGWDMFPYGPGGQIRLNVCFLVGPNELSDSDLMTSYRRWLVFDAFVLHDHFPIFYFDENKVGGIEAVPAGVPQDASTTDYKQIDYDNIAETMFMVQPKQQTLPIMSYSDLYARYQTLSPELKEMIEWFVSQPYRSNTRVNAFFSTNYWQLVHVTILLERLIGMPPTCSKQFGTCANCGNLPQPHFSVSRKVWRRQVLTGRIDNEEVAEDYARAVDEGVSVRNKIAHLPVFDRSTVPEFPPGEPQAYGIDRATTEYEHDTVALQSLLFSLRAIARYILMDRLFATKYFPTLRPLNAVRVVGSEVSYVGL